MADHISQDDWLPFSTLINNFYSNSGAPVPADLSLRESKFRSGLERYLSLLMAKNKEINLTAIDSFSEAVWKHLYDSLLLIHLEPLGKVLDWGSGGGTPGIPLALFRKNISEDAGSVVCLDSIAKKMACVQEFGASLNLASFSAVVSRGELYLEQNKVDTAVMRAVAPPERSIKWVSSHANRWVFMTGPRGRAEWSNYIPKMKSKGFQLSYDNKFILPNGLGERIILSFSR